MFFRWRWGESVIWDTFAFNLFNMKYFCSGWFVFWGVPRNKEHWVTRKLSLGRHYRRWREVERLRGWEVVKVWRCAFDVEGEGRTYRNLVSSTGTILALFVGSRWWMNSSRYALSDKASVNSAKLTASDDKLEWWSFENRGSNPGSARGFHKAPSRTWRVTTRPDKPNASWFLSHAQLLIKYSGIWERCSAFEKRNGSFE